MGGVAFLADDFVVKRSEASAGREGRRGKERGPVRS